MLGGVGGPRRSSKAWGCSRTAVLLCIPLGIVGEALDCGGWAYFGVLMAVGLLAGLVDREGFWGSRPPR